MATVPANDERAPLGEPGSRRSGASTGDVAESPTPGARDARPQSTEHAPDERLGIGTASGGSGPRMDLEGTAEPGAGPGPQPPGPRRVPRGGNPAPPGSATRSTAAPTTSDAGAATEPHHPEEPRDEGAIESFGRAIGEVVTGSDEEDIDPRRPAR